MTTKLAHVSAALEADSRLVVVKRTERNYLPGASSGCHHTVDFIVAPKDGIYAAQELQAFMLSLVPGLVPSSKDDFTPDRNDLSFGRLYFDEEIGQSTLKRELVLTDKTLFGHNGFTKESCVIQELTALKRRIWVRPYPDQAIAREVVEGGRFKFSIENKRLANFRAQAA